MLRMKKPRCIATEMASAGLLRYPAEMAEPEIIETEQAGEVGFIEDLHAKIEKDLTSGKPLAELPAWEVTE